MNTMHPLLSAVLTRLFPIILSTGGGLAAADAVPTTPTPRLEARERELLAALSDVFSYRGKLLDAGASRMQVFARFIDDANPLLQNIAHSAYAFNDANKLSQFGPDRSTTQNEFNNKWRKYVGQSISDAMMSTLTGSRRNDFSDTVKQVEDMAAGPQNQAIWDRSMVCLRAGVRKSMREHAVALMESRSEGRPKGTGALSLRVTTKDGEIWINVTNHTIRPMHNCLITTRRAQDAVAVDEQQKHAVIAGVLGGLLGMSAEANGRNILQGNLLLETQKVEHGALLFVPELLPNESVSAAMAPSAHVEYTTGIFASLWCDEGTEIDATANLAGLKKTAR